MSKTREVEPEGFEELWLLWRDHARKTDGRGKARPMYRNWLLAGAEPQDIIDGARWHLRTLKDEDKPFIQLLSVYINSEKWKDECEKERAFQERQSAPKPTNITPIRPAGQTAFLQGYRP